MHQKDNIIMPIKSDFANFSRRNYPILEKRNLLKTSDLLENPKFLRAILLQVSAGKKLKKGCYKCMPWKRSFYLKYSLIRLANDDNGNIMFVILGKVLGVGGYALVKDALLYRLTKNKLIAFKDRLVVRIETSYSIPPDKYTKMDHKKRQRKLLQMYQSGMSNIACSFLRKATSNEISFNALMHSGVTRKITKTVATIKMQFEKHYLIMEYGGIDVWRWLQDLNNMSADNMWNIFYNLCIEVNDLHVSGYIHRDLKPENILIDDNNQPHVIDYQAAINIKKDQSNRSMTLSIPYAPLEYFTASFYPEKNIQFDASYDLFSLGVVLFHIIITFAYDKKEKAEIYEEYHEYSSAIHNLFKAQTKSSYIFIEQIFAQYVLFLKENIKAALILMMAPKHIITLIKSMVALESEDRTQLNVLIKALEHSSL